MPGEGRVALVHDWLVGWGGSESVLLSFSRLFTDAPIFTFVWDPDPTVEERFGERDVRPAIPNFMPGRGKAYRALLPLMPRAFSGLDLEDFDLVISSSHAFSKAVRTGESARHLCYCHTPPRYLWDLHDVYLPSWRGRLAGPLLGRLRRQDREAADRVDAFIANSNTVAERIRRIYGRTSRVVPPPVDVERFTPAARPWRDREDFLVAGGRLVRYKRVDVAVRIATRMGLPLRVFGTGPAEASLRRAAGPTVEFLGRIPDTDLASLLGRARGFLFPGEEDFGILPVEAQAAGCPVFARGIAGATESVVEDRTGSFFPDSADEDEVVRRLEGFLARTWDPAECMRQARRFSRERFDREILAALSPAGSTVLSRHGSVQKARNSLPSVR